MSSLVKFWRGNIKENGKLISAFLTEIIITGMLLAVYGLKDGQDIGDILFTIWIATNTALFIIMRLIGKGEVADVEDKLKEAEEESRRLRQEAHYNQVIAGYAIQLAALKGQVPESIIHNENWIDANEILRKNEGTSASSPP